MRPCLSMRAMQTRPVSADVLSGCVLSGQDGAAAESVPSPLPRLTAPHCPALPADSALLTGQHGSARVSCGKSKNPGIHEGETWRISLREEHSRPSFLSFEISIFNISRCFFFFFCHFITVNSFLDLSLLTNTANKECDYIEEKRQDFRDFYTPFPADAKTRRVHRRVRAHTPPDLLCERLRHLVPAAWALAPST